MRKTGWTLVESMIVIAIIGILLAIFIPNCMKMADGAPPPERHVQSPGYVDATVEGCKKVCESGGMVLTGMSASAKNGTVCHCTVIQ